MIAARSHPSGRVSCPRCGRDTPYRILSRERHLKYNPDRQRYDKVLRFRITCCVCKLEREIEV